MSDQPQDQQQQQQNNPPPPQQQGGQQDALDKGISFLSGKLGHQTDAATTEKISDGARGLFKKVTGKDVPIEDKQ